MAASRHRQRFEIAEIGRDDLVAIFGKQDQGGVYHVAASGERQ